MDGDMVVSRSIFCDDADLIDKTPSKTTSFDPLDADLHSHVVGSVNPFPLLEDVRSNPTAAQHDDWDQPIFQKPCHESHQEPLNAQKRTPEPIGSDDPKPSRNPSKRARITRITTTTTSVSLTYDASGLLGCEEFRKEILRAGTGDPKKPSGKDQSKVTPTNSERSEISTRYNDEPISINTNTNTIGSHHSNAVGHGGNRTSHGNTVVPSLLLSGSAFPEPDPENNFGSTSNNCGARSHNAPCREKGTLATGIDPVYSAIPGLHLEPSPRPPPTQEHTDNDDLSAAEFEFDPGVVAAAPGDRSRSRPPPGSVVIDVDAESSCDDLSLAEFELDPLPFFGSHDKNQSNQPVRFPGLPTAVLPAGGGANNYHNNKNKNTPMPQRTKQNSDLLFGLGLAAPPGGLRKKTKNNPFSLQAMQRSSDWKEREFIDLTGPTDV